jgi:hypothetical protein
VRSIVAFALAGCGGSVPIGVNANNARSYVSELVAVSTGISAGDDQAVMSAVVSLPTVGDIVARGAAPADVGEGRGGPSFYRAAVDGTCSPSGCSFSYSNGVPDDRTEMFTGSIVVDGDIMQFQVDFQYDGGFSAKDAVFGWSLSGSVLVNGVEVDGQLTDQAGSSGWPHSSTKLDGTVQLRAIHIDANGCPVGGAMNVAADETSYNSCDGGGSSCGYQIQATLGFGPACGMPR